MAMPRQAQTSLYRCYDKRGILLYVGISATALSRMQRHLYRGGWSLSARSVTIEPFRNRAAAQRAELRAIAYEHPKFNLPSARWKRPDGKLRANKRNGSN